MLRITISVGASELEVFSLSLSAPYHYPPSLVPLCVMYATCDLKVPQTDRST